LLGGKSGSTGARVNCVLRDCVFPINAKKYDINPGPGKKRFVIKGFQVRESSSSKDQEDVKAQTTFAMTQVQHRESGGGTALHIGDRESGTEKVLRGLRSRQEATGSGE